MRTVSFFATGELCVSGRNASCLAPSHYLGALSTREVGRGGGGKFEKLETHIVRDIIVRCTCTLFPCCALSDVTSDVCLLLTCARVSVCALRDVGTAVRCSDHCGVWCVTVQGRSHVCVRTVSFFATGELCVSGRNASCLAPSPSLRGPETHTSAKFLTDLRWGSLCGSRALRLSPHSEGREAPVQNHSCRCQLQAYGSGALRKNECCGNTGDLHLPFTTRGPKLLFVKDKVSGAGPCDTIANHE